MSALTGCQTVETVEKVKGTDQFNERTQIIKFCATLLGFSVLLLAGGVWLCALSGQGYQTFVFSNFGDLGLIPVPGDYDGDGKTDPTVYDPTTGVWQILLSGAGYQYCRVTF